jgi:cyclophilin family peptidyl-prolyl cis-trans isomerase
MSNVSKPRIIAQRALAAVLLSLSSWVLPAALLAQARPQVEIRTTLGTIIVELYNETPQHRDNFLKLVREGAYDSLLFHRVIPGFMVQGGDPDSRRAVDGAPLGNGGPGYTVPAEIVPGIIHRKGALAAARQADGVNPERRSSGSQFYIVQGKSFAPTDLDRLNARKGKDAVAYTEADRNTYGTVGGAPHLDGAYTVFGEVVHGLEVIDAIAAQPTGAYDRPLTDIRMFMRVIR